MPVAQDLIHKLEEGAGFKYLRLALIVLVLSSLTIRYNLRCFRNFAAPEAMDAAQVARNLSEGKGFSTLFIRPVSIYLLKQHAENTGTAQTADADVARLKGSHPDLANAPVYPVVLAGAMKILPMRYQHDLSKPFWNSDGRFFRYEPDFIISLINQVFLAIVALATYLLARRLFDKSVAVMATVLLLGCETLWHFSVSGLSTMLLMAIFLGLVWVMIFIEEEVRDSKRGAAFLPLMALLAGLTTGVGTLTRYSFGWLILPVVAFLAVFGGPRRVVLCVLAFGSCLLVIAPWAYRNYALCGLPFGTATYAPLEGTFRFPQFKLMRSLQPNFNAAFLPYLTHKLINNSRNILLNDLVRLGGGWAAPFFIVGLMLSFRNLAIRRLRYFIVACLGVLIVVQAVGRTQLSEETPDFNSENLIILMLPIVLIYAASLFFVLLDQINFVVPFLRHVAIWLFRLIMCLPMIFALSPPRISPVNYPPYFPPAIQQTAGWMKENELMMSDIPWAIAWYGKRQCAWLTLNAQEDYFAVNDFMKPVRALYLTPETMDSRFLSEWVRAGEHSWGAFILDILTSRNTPPTFPLRKMPGGFLPEQLFLTDWDRWKVESSPANPN